MSATVTVQGKAIVAAQPDEIEVLLEMSHLARSHQDALGEVTRRSLALEGIFERLGIGRAEWTTSGVMVAEQYDWENGKHVFRGYRASNRITVRLDNAERIGRLMNEATTEAKAQIHGPTWRIAHDNPARAEACREAARDARRKAEAYVEALGASLGPIVKVIEPGLRFEPPRPMDRVALKAEMASAVPELTVQAGELDVTASVEVTFEIAQV